LKVLITGGAGYIGSKLVEKLLNLGHEVYCIDSFFHGDTRLSIVKFALNKNFYFSSENILDKSENYKNWIKECDVIIPLAALVGFPLCNNNKKLTSLINHKSIEWLVEYTREMGKKIIFLTTNSGYGQTDGKSFCTEETPMNPISYYGTTKVDAEKYLVQNAEHFISFRLATVFGVSYRPRLDLLVNNFTWRAWKDGINVIFEGHSMRNFIHIDDVVDGIEFAIDNWDKVGNQIYNLGNDQINASKLDLAKIVDEQIPHTIIEADIGEDPDKRNYIVSSAKFYATGFKCERSIEMEIPRLIKMFKIIDVPQYANY
jgi:nucleoside-diphosphate-sugar epimerase